MNKVWWLKNSVDDNRAIRDFKYRERNRKPRQEMYFCEDCSHVWERSVYVGYMKYDDMPTYGLTRKHCKDCELSGDNNE